MKWMLMPLRRYADFEGRSRRMEYWMFALMNFVIAMVLMGPFFVGIATADPLVAETDPFSAVGFVGIAGLSLYGLYALAILIPSVAVAVRRLHDREMSGWWYLGLVLAGLIPLVGFIASIALFVLMLLPGTNGPNRFGPDPKNPYEEDVFA